MDILSFEKMELQPNIPENSRLYIGNRIAAKILINGLPYVEVMEPLFDEAAKQAGYLNDANRYIYLFASELYDALICLSDNKLDDGNNVVELVLRLGVFDAAAPACIRVEYTENYVSWACCCAYNYVFSDKELPVFKFKNSQYKEALEQLKVLKDMDLDVIYKSFSSIKHLSNDDKIAIMNIKQMLIDADYFSPNPHACPDKYESYALELFHLQKECEGDDKKADEILEKWIDGKWFKNNDCL